MSCNLESTNWLVAAKSKLACGLNVYTVEQLKTIALGLKIEKLLCKFPDALDEETETSCNVSDSRLSVSSFYDKIKCGETLSDLELLWLESNILIKELEYCEDLYTA